MIQAEGLPLVLGTRERENEAADLAALVPRYASLLFRVAHAVLRNPQEAEDVVQDTFVRVLQHRGSLPEVRNERVWLVRIAGNLALDRRRRARPQQMDEMFVATLAAQLVPADRVLDESRRLSATMDAIERLPQAERSALLLSAIEEMNTAEIAAVLQKSESAVRALLFRARTRLRERLQNRDRKQTKGGVR